MIYIVIPVFNRLNYTRKCLESLEKQTYREFKIILIDDGSTDGTSEYITKNHPTVEVILGDGNLWWTKSTNLGVNKAIKENAEFVLTLNNDTISPPNFLQKMIQGAKIAPDSIIGTSATNEQGKRIFSGERMNWLKGKPSRIKNDDDASGLVKVTHFPGRGMLIPINIFANVGLFDENNFPQYVADFDFSHRARRAGYHIYCNLDSKLIIFPEASGDQEKRIKKSWLNYYNHLFGITGGAGLFKIVIFAFKNCPKVYLVPYLLMTLSRRIIGYWLK